MDDLTHPEETSLLSPADEADFKPDYVEYNDPGCSMINMQKVITSTVETVNLHLIEDLLERPSVVATAVTGVTTQLLQTTNQLSGIATSLDRVSRELGNRKESSVFFDLRKELTSLNHNTATGRTQSAAAYAPTEL
jgi:hypothetical protein